MEKGKQEVKETKLALLNILEDTEEAREKAEEERNKTKLLLSHLADGLLVFSEAKRVELVNPSAERILGLAAKDLLGKSVKELKSSLAFQPLLKVFGEKIGPVSRKEAVIQKRKTVEVSIVPFEQAKKGSGTMVVLHDITREKQVEELKTEFVSLAAHQLRTPLSAIKWTLHMFLDGDLGKITEEQRDILDKTRRANERMIDLVNDLLNVTRIEEGRYVYKRNPVPIGELIEDVIKYYKGEAQGRNIDLQVQYPKDKGPTVWVDREKMNLALQNILENALHYTREQGKVTVRVQYGIKEVGVSVQDNGIGIPHQERNRVFEKFFRASNAKKMETEGSGLGLYLAKNIIEAHGGSIDLKSKENKGTTVSFVIPMR